MMMDEEEERTHHLGVDKRGAQRGISCELSEMWHVGDTSDEREVHVALEQVVPGNHVFDCRGGERK
jgi:hypothetical protein